MISQLRSGDKCVVNYVLLDNVAHKDLKIQMQRGESFGDCIRYAIVVPQEFRQVQSCYPIVFRRNSDTEKFESVALFGFSEKENLFLSDSEWEADYIPLSIQRIPFAIGSGYDNESGLPRPVVHVDMDHPRVSFSEGNAVFLEYGGNTTYLEHINNVLSELIKGIELSDHFIDILLEEKLLEPFTLRLQFENQPGIEISGYYTINEERLKEIDDAALVKLHRQGVLDLSYMVISSMQKIRTMINKKKKLSINLPKA